MNTSKDRPPETARETFFRVNGDFLRATASGTLAWVFWQGHDVPGFEILVFCAVIFAMVAIWRTGAALYGIVRLILGHTRRGRYKAQGAKPKADGMAQEADLKRRGLIR